MNSKALIKKALEEEKIIIGLKEVIKALKAKQAKEIFVAENCPQETLDELNVLGKLQGATITQLEIANGDVGVMCKKPFPITVLALKNE